MPPASQHKKIKGWFEVNSLGIDVGKKNCRGDVIREFFFSNNNEGISVLIHSASHYGKYTAVVESTGSMWIRLAVIENINLQIDTISKELAKYGWDSDYVKILLSMTFTSDFIVHFFSSIHRDPIKI